MSEKKMAADALRAGVEYIVNDLQDTPFLFDLKDILREGIEKLGYTGLYFENGNEECSCHIDDIAPCNNNCLGCELVQIKEEDQ